MTSQLRARVSPQEASSSLRSSTRQPLPNRPPMSGSARTSCGCRPDGRGGSRTRRAVFCARRHGERDQEGLNEDKDALLSASGEENAGNAAPRFSKRDDHVSTPDAGLRPRSHSRTGVWSVGLRASAPNHADGPPSAHGAVPRNPPDGAVGAAAYRRAAEHGERVSAHGPRHGLGAWPLDTAMTPGLRASGAALSAPLTHMVPSCR